MRGGFLLNIIIMYAISGTNYEEVEGLLTEPCDAAFFKEHARIDFDTDDNLIDHYIKAARIILEKKCMVSFGVKKIRFTAVNIPDNYKLMYGPVNNVEDDVEHAGDILKKGGRDVDITFTTKGTLFEDFAVKVAIARYAAGLYVNRENVLDSKLSSVALQDQAMEMLEPYRNIIIF